MVFLSQYIDNLQCDKSIIIYHIGFDGKYHNPKFIYILNFRPYSLCIMFKNGSRMSRKQRYPVKLFNKI